MKRKIYTVIMIINTSLITSNPTEQAFNNVFNSNFWANQETISGHGSTLNQTATLRTKLQKLFECFEIKTIIDAACGDYHWMKELSYSFERYMGFDIVFKLVKRNKELYEDATHQFEHKNIISAPLPAVDIILCRDCLVHLFPNDIKRTINNFKRSGSKYMLITTFTKKRPNVEIAQMGHWRPLNMQMPPFNLPEPLLLLNEGCTEANPGDSFDDKCLGLWRLDDIPYFSGY